MDNDEFKNYQDQESSNNSSSSWVYSETPAEAMALYKDRNRMASEFSNRKKYKTDQRLDDAPEKPKGPPDGFIFDR